MENEKLMTMDDVLAEIKKQAIEPHRVEVKEQFDLLRKEMADKNAKAIIPNLEGKVEDYEGKTFAGSIVDFSRLQGLSSKASGQDIASAFCSQGGFFRKLSPAMELFAKSIRSKGRNFNTDELVSACQKQYEMLGMKIGRAHV